MSPINMIADLLTYLRDIGDTIFGVFMLPGDFLLSQLAAHLPSLALTLRIGDDSSLVLAGVVSFLSWSLAGVLVWLIVRFLQNLARIISAGLRTIFYRLSHAVGSFKTRIVCKIRPLFRRRRSASANNAAEVEFNDLDLAVLRSAAACGPGFATSAPELAEQLMTRPTLVQNSLIRLSTNKMLDTVIGSTEGFDNYRLSRTGAIFVATLQRKWRQAG